VRAAYGGRRSKWLGAARRKGARETLHIRRVSNGSWVGLKVAVIGPSVSSVNR
jgi:ribosomal protein L19